MKLSPKITSKTYYIYLPKSLKLNLLRRTWLSFLVLTIILTPIAGILWNPEHNTAQADTAVYGFAKQIGGTGSDQGIFLSIDSSGNIYSTGFFTGTVDFDPGAGTSNLVSAGSSDIFISKLDSDGDFVWAKAMGGTGLDGGRSLSIDSSGNVYITGYFNGTADFDPGSGTFNLTSAGSYEIFILKLDSNGDFVWAKAMGSTGIEFGNSLSIDSSGNIYITGNFTGTVDFDPGAGASNLISAGSQDIYISKQDSDGDFVWAKAMGGTGGDQGLSLSIDSSDNIYTTGYFDGTADFDPGAGTSNLVSAGSNDIFVSKLDSDGNFVWAKSIGTTNLDTGSSISNDSSDNVYTTGYFDGTADFDPGAGTSNLTSVGGQDIYISKLDSDGDLVWAKNMGSAGSDQGKSVSIDSTDNVYTTGLFTFTADFDPGAGMSDLTTAGSNDVFISKLDSSGDFVWAKSMGGTVGDFGNSLIIDSSDNVYSTGYFQGTADFDPGAGTSNLTSAGGNDIYVSKLSPLDDPTVTVSSTSLVTQDSATLNGNITSLGGPENSATRGFEYGLTDSYGTTITQSDGSYTTGAFSAEVTGLACSTTYYFRAFATNSSGTGYSSGSSQSTAGCPSSGSHSNASQAQNQSPVVVPSPTPTTPTIDLLSPASPGSPSNPLNPKSPTNSTLIPSTERFLRNLGFGSSGEDVKRLQQFLNVNEYTLNNTGAGSPSNETTFFGPRTKAAVKVFQETFASQILAPLGLTRGTGFFGESTRGFVNSLLP